MEVIWTVNLWIMRGLFDLDDLTECYIGYQDAHAASPNGEQAI